MYWICNAMEINDTQNPVAGSVLKKKKTEQ
jgi:hypothetical protein